MLRGTLWVLLVACASCASTSKPTDALIFASAALNAAERSQAERRAPDLFTKAQNAMWRARQAYLAREFEIAREAATEARRLAERAELEAESRAVNEGVF